MLRGEIWLVNLPFTGNSIQGGFQRPMLIIANNKACEYSPVIHALPLTSQSKKWMPTHVEISTSSWLIKNSTALCEQTMLLSKDVFINKIGVCDDLTMRKIDQGISIQFGLSFNTNKMAYA